MDSVRLCKYLSCVLDNRQCWFLVQGLDFGSDLNDTQALEGGDSGHCTIATTDLATT